MTALALAISTLLTIWVTPAGEAIYVAHARRAGGVDRVNELAAAIDAGARLTGQDPWLLAALAYHESGLNPEAVQPRTRAWGLLQLHPKGRASRRAMRYCRRRSDADCIAAQVLFGALLFRRGLEACARGLVGALSFHRFGRCDRDRDRERAVLALRDQMIARGAGAIGIAASRSAAGRLAVSYNVRVRQ